jgi:hypothetical protein
MSGNRKPIASNNTCSFPLAESGVIRQPSAVPSSSTIIVVLTQCSAVAVRPIGFSNVTKPSICRIF